LYLERNIVKAILRISWIGCRGIEKIKKQRQINYSATQNLNIDTKGKIKKLYDTEQHQHKE